VASDLFYRVKTRVRIEQLKTAMSATYEEKPSEYMGTVVDGQILVNGQAYDGGAALRSLRSQGKVRVRNEGSSAVAEMHTDQGTYTWLPPPSGVGPPPVPVEY
jgi:hypothetical protein